jgi:predicted nucleic acid-binding protein
LTYIFDACALLALYKNEKGSDKIEALLDDALAGQTAIYMHSINLIEVYYLFYRALGKDKANLIIEEIYKSPISFIDTIDTTIFSETSRLKAQYAIPLGDAIGLATTIKMSGTFVSADHSDLEKIEKTESVSIFWFR